MSSYSSTMGPRRRFGVVTMTLALTLTALGATGAWTPLGASTPRQLVVKILSTKAYGKILVSVKGFALYTYSRDTKNHSNCTGGCLSVWPPLTLARGIVPVGLGVRALAVIVRSNGQRQVTYQGRPLYFFASDTRAGQTKGEGVGNFSVARLSGVARTVTTSTVKSGYGY